MGISINVGMKQDNSYLFQGLSGSSGNANLNFLSEYASIKNGSYGKLMKAYYAKDGGSEEVSSIASEKNKSTISTSKDTAKTLSTIQGAADDLKESADKLISKSSTSIFNKIDVVSKDEYGLSKTTKEYDVDSIYKSVSTFLNDYNTLVDNAGDASTKSIANKLTSLVGTTKSNENLLSKVGITIGKDNMLSIDEEKFKAADMTTVKSLFNGNSSYAYRVSAQASLIDFAASTESSKANTYKGNGSFSNSYSSGSIFDYGF